MGGGNLGKLHVAHLDELGTGIDSGWITFILKRMTLMMIGGETLAKPGMDTSSKRKAIRVSGSKGTSCNHTNADSPPCCKQIDPSAASTCDSQKWLHILFLFPHFLLTSLARFGEIRVRVT